MVLKEAIIPISYFGPCLHYVMMCKLDTKVEYHENYQKRSYRNRMRIMSPSGPLLLTVPLGKGKHQQLPISQVKIAYDEPWQHQHLKSIKSCYGSSPYYEYYYEELEELLLRKFDLLIELYEACSAFIVKHIGIEISEKTIDYLKSSHDMYDLRKSKSNHDAIFTEYEQVFSPTLGFISNLSILDLLFNLGPETKLYLNSQDITF